MQNVTTRTLDDYEQRKRIFDSYGVNLRVAVPAIVKSVDFQKQTLTCQVAIRERKKDDKGNLEWIDIPELLDVPFFIYSGGGYCITLPIQPGDDCLVIFGDCCIDAWWQSGGVQNQIERRRHDLSDGFAIVGFRSQPGVVSNYSGNSAQLRNKAGDAYIEISGSTINIHGAGGVNIDGGTKIDDRVFLSHQHTGVESGGSNTGGVS